MSFIASIASISTLKEYQFIGDMLEALPILEPLLELLSPLLVILLNSILPKILQFLSMREGPVSASVVEASLFSKLAFFTIIQTFFVSLIGGGLIPRTLT
jgi:Calcium-dependent channel, 7TM region, putative phosphate